MGFFPYSRRRLYNTSVRKIIKIYEDILKDMPDFFPNFTVKSRSWFLYRYSDERYKQALDRLMQPLNNERYSCTLSRVRYRWQWNTEDVFLTKNPTPGKRRFFIDVPDMCPIYHRRVRAGYARPPPEWKPWSPKRLAQEIKRMNKI